MEKSERTEEHLEDLDVSKNAHRVHNLSCKDKI